MKKLQSDAALLAAKVLFAVAVLTTAVDIWAGCATHAPKGRIVQTNYDRPACEAALAQAEAITGLRYAGDGIRVTATKGNKQVGAAWTKDNVGAKTTGGKDRQYISLYTDPAGREQPSELLHEMGHAVLWSHGIYGHPAKYAHLFLNWR